MCSNIKSGSPAYVNTKDFKAEQNIKEIACIMPSRMRKPDGMVSGQHSALINHQAANGARKYLRLYLESTWSR